MSTPTGGESQTADTSETPKTTENTAVQRRAERWPGIVTGAILIGLLAFLLSGIFTMEIPPGATSPGPLVFPIIVSCLVGALLIAQLISLFRPVKASMKGDMSPAPDEQAVDKGPDAGSEQPVADAADDSVNAKAVIGVIGSVVVFIAILQPLGWLLSAALLFVAIGFAMGERKVFGLVAGGLAISSLVQLGFGGGLGLSLPAGILGGVF